MTCPACGAAGDGGAVCAACGKVLHESGRLPLGFMVADRYEIRRFLGEGGMGTVYEAYDRTLEEKIALKLLKADFTHSREMERRFRHEIKLARRLRHPNVCAIHEYGEAGPLRYIALELIEGIDLKRRLRESGALGAAEGFKVALQIAQGLDCIHKAGVVHRDLKASNVMLDRNGDVRLMDFGIAKQIGAEATLGSTAVGSIIGTPEYMSPEQGRGETIDYRSDLYSLGIVTYEIFTGDVPFRGDTPIATIFKTMQEPVDLDGPKAQGIPAALRPVLLCSLAKSASDRYSSADEMAAALTVARDAALGPGGTAPFSPTLIERATAPLAALTMLTPTPAPRTVVAATPPRPAETPTQLTPPTQSARPPWRTPPGTPAPAAGRPAPAQPQHELPPRAERSALPLVLGLVGVVLLGIAGGSVVYFWPESTPPSPPLTVTTTMPGVVDNQSPPPREPIQPGDLSRQTIREATPGPALTPSPQAIVAPTPTPFVRPTVAPTSAPTVAPTRPPPTPLPATPRPVPATTVPAAPGQLRLYVKPWAEVIIDGKPEGTTPLKPVELAAGSHQVLLKHPSYAPLSRQVVIEPGSTTRLEINLPAEGQRLP